MIRGRTAVLFALALCAGAQVRCGASPLQGEPMDAGDDGDPGGPGPQDDGGLLPGADAGSDAGAADDGPDAGADGGADAGSDAGVTATGIQPGDELSATADVNLRSGPGTTYGVLLVIPRTGISRALSSAEAGWVKVIYAAREGFTATRYEQVVPPGSGADLASAFIARGRQAVGFDYWWGHGSWTTESGAAPGGTCSGSCPSCTHTGSFGADCSGMVAKAWMVPASNWSYSTDAHPYSTYNFYNETTAWKPIDRAALAKGDAMVYRDNGAGHVFLFEGGDPWGSMLAIECKGCAAGCVRGYRTAATIYKAIRRDAAVMPLRAPGDVGAE